MSIGYTMSNSSSSSLPSLLQTDTDTDDTDTDSDMDLGIESDITDQTQDQTTECGRDIPPRPTSRLGFNRTLIQGTFQVPVHDKPSSRSHSGTLKWTRSLFQKIGITGIPISDDTESEDMDITTIAASSAPDELVLAAPSPTSHSLISLKLDMDADSSVDDGGNSSDDDDSDCSSCEDIDLDLAPEDGRDLLLFPPQAQSTTPFPTIPDDPSPAHEPIHEPTPRRFSCLPSPLSPSSPPHTEAHPLYARLNNPSRHNYRHHGRSRNALLHLKWFWAVREDEWADYKLNSERAKAYGGMSALPETTGRPSRSLSSSSSNKNNRKTGTRTSQSQLPPLTVHPRRGDISGLRDPYCAHIDRCFAGLPLWTMAKTLWMFDVHMGAERLARRKADAANSDIFDDDVYDEEGESECESMARSMSTGFSDDSDVTLVESENESESEHEAVSGRDGDFEGDGEDFTMEEVDVDSEEKYTMRDDFTLFEAEESPHASSSSTTSTSPERLKREQLSYDDSLPHPKSKSTPKAKSKSKFATPVPYSNPILSSASKRIPNYSRLPWETNWYKRWELLIELVRLDREQEFVRLNSGSAPSALLPAFAVPPVRSARASTFYFAGQGGGGGMDEVKSDWEDDSWEEEDSEIEDAEDALIVPNPLFMGSGVNNGVCV